MGAVVWAESSDDDRVEPAETEAHGEVDETFASRRLRRWLRGMFGGGHALEKPPEDERES
ncbi:MAG: hypothetical protein E6G18_02625 [Actinobacteria bacterium]|nr:MAG: hypothetical protein E6G18_02625 [Actinomycetota bacterium]